MFLKLLEISARGYGYSGYNINSFSACKQNNIDLWICSKGISQYLQKHLTKLTNNLCQMLKILYHFPYQKIFNSTYKNDQEKATLEISTNYNAFVTVNIWRQTVLQLKKLCKCIDIYIYIYIHIHVSITTKDKYILINL